MLREVMKNTLNRILIAILLLFCVNADVSLDDEIQSLDELIRLQQMKLELLKSRRASGSSEEIVDSNIFTPKKQSPESMIHISHDIPDNTHTLTRRSTEIHNLDSMNGYLLERLRIKTNFPISAYHLMTTKPTPILSRRVDSAAEPFVLILAIDHSSVLHVFNSGGAEVLTHDLSRYHGDSRIVASDVEGESEIGPVLATAAMDGSIHLLTFKVTVSNDDDSEANWIVGGTRWSISAFNDTTFSLRSHRTGPYDYVTSLHLYYRGSQRGLGIYVGDSACHFSSFSANGTLTGRVALTGERDGYVAAVDRAAGEGLGDTEVGQCSPRDRGGIGRMTRIGQIMAVPVGHSVALVHIARLYLAPKLCVGGSERILQATIDLKAMTYVFARTVSGALLTFNTKAQSGGGGEPFCELVRVQTAESFSTHTHGSQIGKDHSELALTGFTQRSNSLISLRGSVLSAGGCHLTLINTTDVKKSRASSYEVAATSYSHGCRSSVREFGEETEAVSPLWLDVTPRYQRDYQTRRPVEVFVSVAFNQYLGGVENGHSGEEKICSATDECSTGSSATGRMASSDSAEIILYFSMIEVMEEVDELEWVRWPMMCAGVAAFFLFKYFNSNRSHTSKLKGRTGRLRGGRESSRSPEDAAEEENLKNQLRRLQEMSTNIHRMSERADTVAGSLSPTRSGMSRYGPTAGPEYDSG